MASIASFAGLHPALWTLLRLRALGGVRRSWQVLKRPRGAVAFLIGTVLLGYVLAPLFSARSPLPPLDHQLLGTGFQSGLLTLTILSQIKAIGDRAVYFTPSEVDFLFTAPVNRRELLIYRILSAAGGVAMMSVFLALIAMVMGAWWLAAFLGAALGFVFLHQLAMALMTVREIVEARTDSFFGTALVVGALLAIVVSLALSTASGVANLSHAFTFGLFGRILDAGTLQLLLTPFKPFAELLIAQRADADSLTWLAVCITMNLALFWLLVRLDAGNLRAAEALEHRDARLRNAFRGRRWSARPLPLGGLLVRAPRLQAVGTLAAVQCISALRGYRLLIELGVVVGVLGYLLHLSAWGQTGSEAVRFSKWVYFIIWLTVIVGSPLRFDFRGDPRTIDILKALPTPAWAICLAQLSMPVLIALVFQAPFLLQAVRILDTTSVASAFSVAIGITLSLNLFWFSLENGAFLLQPSAQASRGLGDMQFIGRQLVLVSVKFGLLVSLMAVALAVAWMVTIWVGWNPAVFIVAVLVVLLAGAALAVLLLVWLFRNFDPGLMSASDL